MDVSADVELRGVETGKHQTSLLQHGLQGERDAQAERTTIDKDMKIDNRTFLATGADRGIGRALAEETDERGGMRVCAGTPAAAKEPED